MSLCSIYTTEYILYMYLYIAYIQIQDTDILVCRCQFKENNCNTPGCKEKRREEKSQE